MWWHGLRKNFTIHLHSCRWSLPQVSLNKSHSVLDFSVRACVVINLGIVLGRCDYMWLCLDRGFGPGGLHRSLPTSTILWKPGFLKLFYTLQGLKNMQEQNWWTVFLFPPWWCVLLHSQDTGWMKWANFAQKNILIPCTIQDLLLREQGNASCIYNWFRVKYHTWNFSVYFTTTTEA